MSRNRRMLSLVGALCLLALVAAPQVVHASMVTRFSSGLSSAPSDITAGPGGNLWFTEHSRIGRITTSGAVTEFPLAGDKFPGGIVTRSDGNLWFTRNDASTSPAGQIARMTPAGAVTDFSAGISRSYLGDITAGPDGNLWFTETSPYRVARITPSGAVTEFASGLTGSPSHITAGPDGNLWFTERGGGRIGRITPAGDVTELASTISGEPVDIAAGPDGNVWFTERTGRTGPGGLVGRVTPAGVITEFPTRGAGAGITTAVDGNLWITEHPAYEGETGGNPGGGTPPAGRLARITPSGSVTEYCDLPEHGIPQAIAAGPDGNLWFSTLEPGPYVGRVSPADSQAPLACTGGAEYGSAYVRVSGWASAEAGSGTAHFEYGTTSAYGSSTPGQDVTGSSKVYLEATLENLRPNSTYHYRIVFRRAGSVTYGDDQTVQSDSGWYGPEVYIVPARVTFDAHGAGRVKLACTTDFGHCEGRLTLTKRLRVRVPRSRHTRITTIRLATTRLSLTGGVTSIRIVLNRRARRLLADAPHRRLAVRAVATSRFNIARRPLTLIAAR